MRKMILLLIALGFSCPVFAKAYFAGKKDMIKNADCIVVVEITKVEPANKKGTHWSYRQKATATVKQCLKGTVKADIEIYGLETFKCGRCIYSKGRFILFLDKLDGFWKGANWHLGIRPIIDGKVEWFKNDQSIRDMKPAPLADVISEIETVIKASPKQKK